MYYWARQEAADFLSGEAGTDHTVIVVWLWQISQPARKWRFHKFYIYFLNFFGLCNSKESLKKVELIRLLMWIDIFSSLKIVSSL